MRCAHGGLGLGQVHAVVDADRLDQVVVQHGLHAPALARAPPRRCRSGSTRPSSGSSRSSCSASHSQSASEAVGADVELVDLQLLRRGHEFLDDGLHGAVSGRARRARSPADPAALTVSMVIGPVFDSLRIHQLLQRLAAQQRHVGVGDQHQLALALAAAASACITACAVPSCGSCTANSAASPTNCRTGSAPWPTTMHRLLRGDLAHGLAARARAWACRTADAAPWALPSAFACPARRPAEQQRPSFGLLRRSRRVNCMVAAGAWALTVREKYPPARVCVSKLGRLDSNQDPQIQSLVCCHCTTPQGTVHALNGS